MYLCIISFFILYIGNNFEQMSWAEMGTNKRAERNRCNKHDGVDEFWVAYSVGGKSFAQTTFKRL